MAPGSVVCAAAGSAFRVRAPSAPRGRPRRPRRLPVTRRPRSRRAGCRQAGSRRTSSRRTGSRSSASRTASETPSRSYSVVARSAITLRISGAQASNLSSHFLSLTRFCWYFFCRTPRIFRDVFSKRPKSSISRFASLSTSSCSSLLSISANGAEPLSYSCWNHIKLILVRFQVMSQWIE